MVFLMKFEKNAHLRFIGIFLFDFVQLIIRIESERNSHWIN